MHPTLSLISVFSQLPKDRCKQRPNAPFCGIALKKISPVPTSRASFQIASEGPIHSRWFQIFSAVPIIVSNTCVQSTLVVSKSGISILRICRRICKVPNHWQCLEPVWDPDMSMDNTVLIVEWMPMLRCVKIYEYVWIRRNPNLLSEENYKHDDICI